MNVWETLTSTHKWQIALSFVGNWSSVVTADLQTPAQLTAAVGAVATRKNHAAGEEQSKTRTQGEATYKQCTTSEYSNCLSDHTRTTEWTWRIFYYFVTILWTAVQKLLCTWSHAYTDCVCIFSKKQCCYTSCYSFTVLFDWHTLWLPLLSLDFFPVSDAAVSSCVVLQQHTNVCGATHLPADAYTHFSAVEKQHTEQSH